MKRVHHAWAINTRSAEGHGFLGIWCWFDGAAPKLPMHVQGCSTALWPTREAARAALAHERTKYFPWPRARVERVTVAISPTAGRDG